jgi:hypothetical protein
LVGGGIMVRAYLNRFSMQGGSVIDIRVHPNMPAGTILMTTKVLPYPLAGVGKSGHGRIITRLSGRFEAADTNMGCTPTKSCSAISRHHWH